jgi:sec-independent protein translocase protein TatB
VFDIGWSELLVVVVVAVVVVGPKDLPRMMRVAGQWMGRARAMADQFRRSFDDMARQAELEELRAEVMKLHNEKSLTEIQRETDVMLGLIPAGPVTALDAEITNVETDPELLADLEADSPLSVGGPEALPPSPEPLAPPQHRDEP